MILLSHRPIILLFIDVHLVRYAVDDGYEAGPIMVVIYYLGLIWAMLYGLWGFLNV